MSNYNQCGECKHTTKPGCKYNTIVKACKYKHVTFMDDTSECQLFEKRED